MTGGKSRTRLGKPVVVLTGLFLLVLAPAAPASTIDLYDFALHTSTGISGDWQDISTADPASIIDPSSTIACCGDASGGSTTGLGTVNYSFYGAPGSYTVSLYFDFDVSTPFFNEYGAINNGSAAPAGISGEIFQASPAGGNIVLFPANGTPGGETYGAADGLNHVPGSAGNYLNNCTAGLTCDGDAGMALTYSFTLGANQYALLSADASTTDPGGFSLETIHPVDANNTALQTVFLTGSFTINDVPSGGAPEPSTWVLLAGAFACFGAWGVRRQARG